MFEYLNDTTFLAKLDKLNLRTQYIKITLLTFDEKPIKEIQGNITSGNLSVNGSSSVRRTISFSMLASYDTSNIEDIDNEISANKKIKVSIGYKNPFKSYSSYGDIIWFPCGLFVISTANISRSTSGWNISVTGKDKMCLLDGTAGGTLPASTTFHEKYVYLDNGDIEIYYPTIYEIIFEAVNHWGGEPVNNIIISDIDDTVKMLVKYLGDSPIYFSSDYSGVSFSASDDFPYNYSYGEDVGYEETDFTYPSELILEAGDTVTTLLDKIVETLGNYEYFYDLDGRFVFQEIKNYLNSGNPLNDLSAEDYIKDYNSAKKFQYSLTDLDTITAITRSPNYSNIKNDFYVWGERETSSGAKVSIRYHLAIDKKPPIDYASYYMWEIKSKEANLIIRYDFNDIASGYAVDGYEATLVGSPCDEWREELYRKALIAQVASSICEDEHDSKLIEEWQEELQRREQATNNVYDNYYDAELIAEWRGLYDPTKEKWKTTRYWNPDVFENPEKLNYWLDFIDTGSAIGKYSVSQIGRRTKVINSSDINSLYNKEVPDIVFIENNSKAKDLIAQCQATGQQYFVWTPQLYSLFSISSTGISCFDRIREMMYQNLSYNTSISITCLPKYYMEPNNVIHIEDRESGINGNYQITQFSLPLAYNGTMSITATEVLTRV